MFRFQGRTVKLLVIFLSTMVGFSAQAKGEKQKEPEFVPGEFVVKLKPHVAQAKFTKDILGQNLKSYIKNQIEDLNLVVIKRPVFETKSSVIENLSNNPLVEYIEPNFIYRINKTPNDPMIGQLWGLQNLGASDSDGATGVAGVDVDAVRAWDIQTGSSDVVVAVIDTGVNYNHPDLVDNMWVNEVEKNGQAGVDDDQNGIVDDIHGANFVTASAPTGDPMDDHGHGSHCSGTIGAKGDDGKGLVGVAWNTKIMALKFLSASGGGSLEGAVQAINYANKMGAKILSNSWGGGGFSQALKDVIDQSNEKGTLFVAAAGNDGANNDSSATYPANYEVDNVLSVAAINNRGQLASFSNYGRNKVHVGAPGVNVVSITTAGYESWSGTSMATPHVSGIAVLLASQDPNMSGIEMKNRIMETAKPIASLKRKVKSKGVANAYLALMNQSPEPDLNDPEFWSRTDKSLSTDHPYADKFKAEWTIEVPGANEISLYFSRFDTENGYDFVELYDAQGKLIQKLSGNNDESFSYPIPGNKVRIVMTTDESYTKYGFDITQIAYR
ncbi:MAG: S8 family serine peptidase [Bdellovibrionales bacterium]